MKFATSLIAVAGLAAAANAATSTLTWQVSVNGGGFVSGVNIPAAAGDTVTFRLRVSLIGNTGTGSIGGAGGLAGFNFLPTLSNFGGSDTALALNSEQFPEGSVNNPFPGVINHPDLGTITNVYTGVPATFRGPGNVGGTGRNAPWGSNGTNTNGVATSSVASGVLSWRAGVIGNAGVSLSQLNANNSSISAVTGIDDAGTPGDTSDDGLLVGTIGSFANNSRTNLFVFSYSVVLGESLEDRTMVASSSVLTPVQWFTSAAGASASTAGPAVTEASILVPGVPAPGALALLGLGGLVAGRRRR